ncbi:hypothetical protein L1765_11205 [Microaerobacter geothermalis]|uniref:hypothetical protein n=1 Tax=Microaerobacter geothermalis TaxID=674972 RepID=UPI001F3D1AE9|nr:hypothetical protein [Microaerobacter geothermalis]MCF6094530.1 hypothetical protein [Microaerobacter geothermalis]
MKREDKIMWDFEIDPVLRSEFEACDKEYGDAPKLSEEELDRIIKEVRRDIRNGKVSK